MKRRRPLPPLPKRAARLLARLKKFRGLSEDEKALHALGLAATPEERWQLVRNHVRLFNSSPRSKQSA
jgi:hypothetical protein